MYLWHSKLSFSDGHKNAEHPNIKNDKHGIIQTSNNATQPLQSIGSNTHKDTVQLLLFY